MYARAGAHLLRQPPAESSQAKPAESSQATPAESSQVKPPPPAASRVKSSQASRVKSSQTSSASRQPSSCASLSSASPHLHSTSHSAAPSAGRVHAMQWEVRAEGESRLAAREQIAEAERATGGGRSVGRWVDCDGPLVAVERSRARLCQLPQPVARHARGRRDCSVEEGRQRRRRSSLLPLQLLLLLHSAVQEGGQARADCDIAVSTHPSAAPPLHGLHVVNEDSARIEPRQRRRWRRRWRWRWQ
jgi:hypothetical protein